MTYVNNVSKVNNMSIFMNHLKCLLLFLENLKFLFCNIYNDGKPNYKKNYWDKNHYLGSDCNNKQIWNDDKCRCECKELNDKGVCDKGFVWNPSNCQCKCYKSCDFSEYLDYKKCKCKKSLVNKLADQFTENVEETRLVKVNTTEYDFVEKKWKHNSRTMYIVLCSIGFTINVGIYFHWYLKKDVTRVTNLMSL